MPRNRRNHYDVTDRIDISDPSAVCEAVCRLLSRRYPELPVLIVQDAFDVFARLYAGLLPEFAGCDTGYHDVQHTLDCSLAMARLLDGHAHAVELSGRWPDGTLVVNLPLEGVEPGDPDLQHLLEPLDAEHATLGILMALFHDAGYIRARDDDAANGAAFTLNHVARSGELLAGLLPRWGLASRADVVRDLLHFTGYEVALADIAIDDDRDRILGHLLATADALCQTADRCYPEKCRDFLYVELAICGLAGDATSLAVRETLPRYGSANELLQQTPGFLAGIWRDRLEGHFGGLYRLMALHFGGRNPYVEQVCDNLDRLRRHIDAESAEPLNRRPQPVDAIALRRRLSA